MYRLTPGIARAHHLGTCVSNSFVRSNTLFMVFFLTLTMGQYARYLNLATIDTFIV